MRGIDVSHHQGNIDWASVKAFGIEFVIMKAMYENGHRIESSFLRNYEGAAGLNRGAYIYNIARNVEQAVEEAEDFVKILGGRELEFGVWLDMEDSKISKLSRKTLWNIIDTEAEIITRAGYHVGIYCNKYWYTSILDGSSLSKRYDFWVARYPQADNGTIKESLAPRYAKIWQYSSKGRVPGITGNVDMDIELSDLFDNRPTGNPYAAPNKTLKNGSKGESVKWLQWELTRKGLPLTIDGIFGPATENAVRHLQNANMLVCDGIVGQKTIAALIE